MEKQKLYYRGENGEFITANEWFKLRSNKLFSVCVASDFREAVKFFAYKQEKTPANKTFCALAILGAHQVTEHNNSDTLTISVYANGDCTVWYKSDRTGGSREDILNRVFQHIDDMVILQGKYASQASASFVEI